jgi:hypothetical protein
VQEYFKLQLKINNRRFTDFGYSPILGYTFLIVLFAGLSICLFQKIKYSEYIYVLFAFGFTSKLSEIKRNEFLNICFGDKKAKKIRVTENLMISFPFLAFLLYKQFFILSAALLLMAILSALTSIRTSFNLVIPTPFYKKPFEFTVGFRNTFYLYFIAYILAGIAVSVDNFNLGVFALLLVCAGTLSYYTKPENEYYVWTHSQLPKTFLFEKIKTAIFYSTVLYFPVVLILSIAYVQNIQIMLLFMLMGYIALSCVILAKYSAYPNEMNVPQGILLSLSIFFPPMLLVSIPYFFSKSVNRLDNFLK